MRFRPVCLLLLCAGPLAADPPPAAVGSTSPPIVVILADDLGYGDLGVYGNTEIPTPRIDALARRGVRFTDGYVTSPVCAPTRAGLLAGRYPQRFGFESNPALLVARFGLPATERTLAEKLKQVGYATGLVGKWHLGYAPETAPLSRGFDEFFGFLAGAHAYRPGVVAGELAGRPELEPRVHRNGQLVDEREYLTDAFAREAVSFVARHRDHPFFLYLAFNAVHDPLDAPPQYTERFRSIADPKRRQFAGMLSALDAAVGRVLDALVEHGLDERALVFFFSDNGGPTALTTASNRPLRGGKGQVLEGGIRVPFLVRWPAGGVPAGAVCSHPVMSLDVHATSLAAAGVSGAAAGVLDGRDLRPFLVPGGEGAPHEALYWRFERQWAVRKGRWKLVALGAERGDPVRLYDLAVDPGEARDLARQQPRVVAELRAAYERWNAANPAPAAQGGWIRATFDRLDASGDGLLSAAEYAADSTLRLPFPQVDTDDDLRVSYDELAAAYARFKPRR